MNYYNTSNPNQRVNLSEAVLHCIAADGGVFMPTQIPLIPYALFKNIPDMSLTEIAYVVATTMFGSEINPAKLNEIVKETLNFQIPLVELGTKRYAVELFHGPTGSFKDIGARFMSRIVDFLINGSGSTATHLNVFVATSGDTGCAIAQAFAGLKNVDVNILYPKGQLLRTPHHSFASDAPNIHPIGIRGTFEQCQMLVKQIHTDPELIRTMNITSANSINIARLLPQIFYFFHAYARMKQADEKVDNIVIATPCGNLGNLTAALFSFQMGLPITRIIAAGHDNERLWGSISSGSLKVNAFNAEALSTNIERINSLLSRNPSLTDKVECQTMTDSDIDNQIISTYKRFGYLMDRNTAMASAALDRGIRSDETGIFLATASPDKNASHLVDLLGNELKLCPLSTENAERTRTRKPDLTLPALFGAVKRHLLDNNPITK